MKLKPDFVREQFPAFGTSVLKRWSHFENAGGSYMAKPVADLLAAYYSAHRVQPYASYPASKTAGKMMDAGYETLAAILNVDVDEVFIGPSTSANSYTLSHAIAPMLDVSQNIVVTNQDHEANTGAWRRMAEARGVEIREWKVSAEGQLDRDDLWPLVDDKTAFVAMPHASNIIGSINQIGDICRELRSRDILSIIDGVAYVPHAWPDLGKIPADIYMFSTYKTFGPHQGVTVIRRELAARLANQGHYFNNGEPRYRLNPAGPDHAQVAAMAGMGEYIKTVHRKFFKTDINLTEMARDVSRLQRAHETRHLETLLDGIAEIDALRVIGQTDTKLRVPTVSLYHADIPGAKLAKALRDYNIMASGGNFYAPRVLEGVGIDPDHGILRLSFVHYVKGREIESVLKALRKVSKT